MHRLLLTATGNQLSGLSAEHLLWRPHGEPSSVETTLGPRMEGIGDVPPLNSDFVRLAATVFFVDRTVSRPRMLRRSLDVEVAVHDPALWDPHSARLGAVLGLLSGDEWTLSFRRRREPRQGTTNALDPADVSLLFSGGADSMCGALLARDEGLAPLLVSHFDWRNIGGQQTNALNAYEQHLGQRPANIRWRFARRATQVGSGATFPNETSRRTRSLLFMAFGAAVSAVTQTDSGSRRTDSRRSIHRCRRSPSVRCRRAPPTRRSSPACGKRSRTSASTFPSSTASPTRRRAKSS